MPCEGIPPGGIPNGSFEADADFGGVPDHWVAVFYPGGTGEYDASDYVHGRKSYRFVHPGGQGRGGGYLESDYIFVNPLFFTPIRFACKSSVSGIKVACVLRHFDRDKVFLGEQEVYASVDHPADWGLVVVRNVPYVFAGAEYVRVRLIGGKDDTDVAGTVWFDAVGVEGAPASIPAGETIDQAQVTSRSGAYRDVGDGWAITVPSDGKVSWLFVGLELKGHSWSNEMGEGASFPKGRFRIGSRYSSEATGPGKDEWDGPYFPSLRIDGLSGKQQLRFQLRAEPDAGGNVYLRSPASARKYFRPNTRTVDVGEGTLSDSGT
jgi:hypothetical protein